MLKTKQTLTALLLGTLLSSGAMAAEKADKQFIDDSSYAVGVLMGKNIEGVMESQKEVFTYNQDKILDGVKDTLKKIKAPLKRAINFAQIMPKKMA